jgi:hypothetical protein
MKIYLIAFIVLVAVTPVSGLAVLGTTVDECNDRYGKPLRDPYTFDYRGQRRTRYEYRWKDFFVIAVFVGADVGDTRCASILYEKIANVTSTGANQKMTAAEIENILALNANGSSWKRTRRGWIGLDEQTFVYEFNYIRNGFPGNTLAVFERDFDPQLAARLIAGSSSE